jgi:hypothetical protein
MPAAKRRRRASSVAIGGAVDDRPVTSPTIVDPVDVRSPAAFVPCGIA